MAASLRRVCARLGLVGHVSVCRDIFGFSDAHVPVAIEEGRPQPALGLNRFVQLLGDRHFHVRVIVAGSDLLTADDRHVIDYAIFRMRDIYSAGGIGIGVVSREARTAANSGGHESVTTDEGVTDAGTDITADGDLVPVVVPADMDVTRTNPDGTMTVLLGRSPVEGPCSPRTGDGMRSAVVDIAGEGMGRTLAHEVGHYLGADHPEGTPGTNLMAQTGDVDDPFVSVDILPADRTTMRDHCTMRPGLRTT